MERNGIDIIGIQIQYSHCLQPTSQAMRPLWVFTVSATHPVERMLIIYWFEAG